MKRKYLNVVITALIVLLTQHSFARKIEAVRNIVLVHGAFVDGTGWEAVYKILKQKGYHVSVTQHTLLSYQNDVAAVNRIIDQQPGPCILVGHSYGGAVITEAGNNPKVAGVVYIAAHAPDEGESEADNGRNYPAAYKSLIKGEDGLDYIDPEKFPQDFAGGVPSDKAKFMAMSQMPAADSAFHAVIKNPAWKTKPVWYMVAGADRIINPDLERMYARRANSVQTVEIAGASHCVFITHPEKVAKLIISAASSAQHVK